MTVLCPRVRGADSALPMRHALVVILNGTLLTPSAFLAPELGSAFSPEAAQKGLATRPQAKQSPEAYPLGYVEDGCETRTTLRAFFSSRLSSCRLVGTYR